MNILLMTNTYKPLLGGLERSIELFTNEYRQRGHHVLIVVPEYPDAQPEEGVVRIPAVENFKGTNFSLQLPIPGMLEEALKEFRPDIIHSQHPFLVGDTALRVASKYNVPLVFTHHTLFEENVHYVSSMINPHDLEDISQIEGALKRFVIELSSGYANLTDCVFAPSESIMKLMKDRGVQTPIHVVPTGLYVNNYTRGAGKAFRQKLHIPYDAWVVGHIGRLAPEKNLDFLAKAVVGFIKKHHLAHFLIGGQGPSEEIIRDIFSQEGLSERLHMAGILKGKELVDAYHAMNVFVFASQSETQGLVLDEAMASGVPVVAVDAPGVREVVQDRVNGCLLAHENIDDFVRSLEWIMKQPAAKLKEIKIACKQTAKLFSMDKSVEKALGIYSSLCIQGFARKTIEQGYWESKLRIMQAQWGLIKNMTKATGAMMGLVESEA